MEIKCQICGQGDSALTPIYSVSNASEFDTITEVCSDCVSTYDGMFAWEDGSVIYI